MHSPNLSRIKVSAFLGWALLTFGAPKADADDHAAIPFAQTPPAVQKTIVANLRGGTLAGIEKAQEDGVVSYSVEFAINGQSRDMIIDEDGTLFSLEVTFQETPPPVQKAIVAQIAGGKLDAIEKTFDIDEVSYEVEFTAKDGSEGRCSLGENGALLEIDIPLRAAPPAVQKTLAGELKNVAVTTLTKIIDDADVSYEADFNRDGKDVSLTIATDGRLLSEQITLAEATPQARKTIQDTVGNGKIIAVSKSYEKKDKVLPFMVEAVKDGKRFNFSVGPKGKFLGMDE